MFTLGVKEGGEGILPKMLEEEIRLNKDPVVKIIQMWQTRLEQT